MITSGLQDEIKRCMDRHKPPVHSDHSLHEKNETSVNSSIFKKSCREMRRGTQFCRQLLPLSPPVARTGKCAERAVLLNDEPITV